MKKENTDVFRQNEVLRGKSNPTAVSGIIPTYRRRLYFLGQSPWAIGDDWGALDESQVLQTKSTSKSQGRVLLLRPQGKDLGVPER